jgi:hypothetical protein
MAPDRDPPPLAPYDSPELRRDWLALWGLAALAAALTGLLTYAVLIEAPL